MQPRATSTIVKWAFWIVLALLPIALLSLFAFRTASQTVTESIETNQRAAAVVGADVVEENLQRNLDLTESMAKSDSLREAVERQDTGAARALLRSVITFYPTMDRAAIHRIDGNLWDAFPPAPESTGHGFEQTEWFQGVTEDWEPFISPAYVRPADPQMIVVAIAVPVRDDNEEVIAILVTQFLLDSINESLRHVRWGETGTAILLDPNGRVAGHPEIDLEEGPYDHYAQLDPVQQALRGDAVSGEIVDPVNDERTIATFYPVELTNRDWVVVARQPVADAYAPIRTIAWNIGGAGAILAFAAAAVVLTLWRVSEHNRRLSYELQGRSAMLQEQTERLRSLAAELTSTEQRERKRLAALLHDDLQQLLAAAELRLNSVSAKAGDGQLKKGLEEANAWLGRASAAARNLTHELRPPALYEAGVVAALEWLTNRMKEWYGLRVEVESETDLEPLNDDFKALLFDCIRELLLNTAKHAGVGDATVSLFRENACLCVVVTDKGKGFDVEAESKREKKGFGLFSIRERLLALGGEMAIDSKPGRGTRTKLTLPIAIATSESPAFTRERPSGEPPAKEEEKSFAGTASEPVRVLVVDDHAMVRQGIANILNHDRRIQVVGEAGDGIEAIQAVSAARPNVVLMDLNMPRMNGIEATREIHRRWPETYIIGLSVQGDSTTAQSMRDAGAETFLPKTGDAERMVTTIVTMNQRSRSSAGSNA